MQDLVQFAKALADPTRVRILAALRGEVLCVCEIADALDIPQSSLSTHLQCLRAAGLVQASKKGTWAYYAISERAKPVLAGLDTHFDTHQDPVLRLDEARLQARLFMREDGHCVVGSRPVVPLVELVKP